jgi:hypothetical protein
MASAGVIPLIPFIALAKRMIRGRCVGKLSQSNISKSVSHARANGASPGRYEFVLAGSRNVSVIESDARIDSSVLSYGDVVYNA